MRELTMNESFEVDGGAVPVAVWAAVTVGSAVIGAVGGYMAGNNNSNTTTVNVELSCSAE